MSNNVTWSQANDPNTWSHINDPNTYTMTNTATQTLNAVQIGTQKQNYNVVFHGPNGKEVGRFDFSGGELRFDGSADISAQVFIEWASRTYRERLINEKLDVFKRVHLALSKFLVHQLQAALHVLDCYHVHLSVMQIHQCVEGSHFLRTQDESSALYATFPNGM